MSAAGRARGGRGGGTERTRGVGVSGARGTGWCSRVVDGGGGRATEGGVGGRESAGRHDAGAMGSGGGVETRPDRDGGVGVGVRMTRWKATVAEVSATAEQSVGPMRGRHSTAYEPGRQSIIRALRGSSFISQPTTRMPTNASG